MVVNVKDHAFDFMIQYCQIRLAATGDVQADAAAESRWRRHHDGIPDTCRILIRTQRDCMRLVFISIGSCWSIIRPVVN